MRFAPGTWRLASLPVAIGVALLALSSGWGFLGLVAGVFVVWFHRDPEREPPDRGVLAPADGRVTVRRAEESPDAKSRAGKRVRVGVFMNVTDVHVNRAPVSGTVESLSHVPGAHRPAFSKESERNERVVMDLDGTQVTLIAGAFARRIHPHVEAGETVERGERIGHVSFGSRADVLLPPSYEMDDLAVDTGDTVRAGETVIATRPSTE